MSVIQIGHDAPVLHKHHRLDPDPDQRVPHGDRRDRGGGPQA